MCDGDDSVQPPQLSTLRLPASCCVQRLLALVPEPRPCSEDSDAGLSGQG